MRAARSEYDAPAVRTVDASDIGPQHPVPHGQNDREIVLNCKNARGMGRLPAGEQQLHVWDVLTYVLHVALADDGERIGDHGGRSFCRASWNTSCVLVSLFWSS